MSVESIHLYRAALFDLAGLNLAYNHWHCCNARADLILNPDFIGSGSDIFMVCRYSEYLRLHLWQLLAKIAITAAVAEPPNPAPSAQFPP